MYPKNITRTSGITVTGSTSVGPLLNVMVWQTFLAVDTTTIITAVRTVTSVSCLTVQILIKVTFFTHAITITCWKTQRSKNVLFWYLLFWDKLEIIPLSSSKIPLICRCLKSRANWLVPAKDNDNLAYIVMNWFKK